MLQNKDIETLRMLFSSHNYVMTTQYAENDYILKWDDGRPFTPDYVSHRFSRLLEI